MPSPAPLFPHRARRWLLAMAALIVVGVVVPYGVLSGAEPGLGIAIFWLVFGLAVAAMVLLGVARWRDKP